MIKSTTLTVCFLLFIAMAISCANPPPVRIGAEGAYPPFGFLNEAGELEGFEIDLGNELCQRASLECHWVTNDWESMITNLRAGRYDTIMAGMSITEERDELIDFTQPYFPPEESVFAALAGAAEDVTRARVAVQTATIQADYLEGRVAELMDYGLAEETIEAVLNGQADSTFASHSYLKDIVSDSQGRLEFVGPPVLLDSGVGIGVREEDVELRKKLDEAIGSMKEDGSLNALIIRWFGEGEPTF